MPRIVEGGINAMSLFSNDQTVIDQASAVDRGTCNNEGLERKWGLTPKSIKTIEPRKEECRIYLKEFWGTGCFESVCLLGKQKPDAYLDIEITAEEYA